MVFQEHNLRLFLDRTLYLAFIKLQADKELGRSFAGLLCFVEGIHNLGYIGDQDYEKYQKRYSTPLDKNPEQVALMEVQAAKKLKEQRALFRQVTAQFELHKHDPTWIKQWREKAIKNGELPEAKQLLALIEEVS